MATLQSIHKKFVQVSDREIKMKSICVFCGSSSGSNPVHTQSAKRLGKILADQNITLIYGGGKIGLMGIIADTVLENHGKVIGVIPTFMLATEVAHQDLTELHTVDSMHVRKALMEKLSDGFIAMAGGFGTMDELFEILTWSQLGLHRKPVGLLNINGYYDDLMKFIFHTKSESFVKEKTISHLIVESDELKLLQRLQEKTK